jgi:hypothetical protein
MQPGDGAFGHVDTELEKLTMNSRAPQRGFAVAMRVLVVDARAAGGAAGELGPVLAETAPLPPQDGVGSHDHPGLFPPGADSGRLDPEEAISLA